MEPAGRYAKENFRAFVKPRVSKFKSAIVELGRSIWLLTAAVCFALSLTVVKIRSSYGKRKAKKTD